MNPLKKWLDDSGKTQRWFAAKLAEECGWKSPVSMVNRYYKGHSIPGPAIRSAIARVSRGAVPADAWGK